MKKIFIVLSAIVLSACATPSKEVAEKRAPNQVTGDFGKTFLNQSSSDTISDYFVSLANNPKSDVFKVIDKIRTEQNNFGILQEEEKIPVKIAKKNFTVLVDSFEDYRGKVDGDGNIVDAPYSNTSATISVPVVNRYYGGRIEVLSQLQFTCTWDIEKSTKNKRECKLLKNVDMP